MSDKGNMFGPSLIAWSGCGWVSKKYPVAPKALAASAMAGTYFLSPPVLPPAAPGRCTL